MTRINRTMIMATVSFVFTMLLCVQTTNLQAQELGDTPFEFAIVIQGQSLGAISSTATTPFDLTNVGILSIGNQGITANLDMTSEQIGAWWIALLNIGQQPSVDFSFGVAPLLGQPAQIFVDFPIGFAVATGGVFALDEVSEEVPLTYNINITGG